MKKILFFMAVFGIIQAGILFEEHDNCQKVISELRKNIGELSEARTRMIKDGTLRFKRKKDASEFLLNVKWKAMELIGRFDTMDCRTTRPGKIDYEFVRAYDAFEKTFLNTNRLKWSEVCDPSGGWCHEDFGGREN